MEDCCICQPAAYWRAASGAEVGPFDDQLQYAMDMDYWIRFDRRGFVLQHLPVTIAESRLHDEAKTLRARGEIYHEIFRVSRERGGYISRSYVYGFWDHLLNERRGTQSRPRLRVPGAVPAVLSSAHWAWLNRRSAESLRGARLAAKSRVAHRLQATPRLLTAALKAGATYRRARYRLAHRAGNGGEAAESLRVRGFWRDNWVGDRLDVVVDASEQARTLSLVGRPVADMTVRVSANGMELARFDLSAGQEEDVVVELPAGPRERLTFTFSEHAVDAAGRAVAFQLQATDAFREEDLYALG
jgi:hypothetical protein